jgi:hypothetical protein
MEIRISEMSELAKRILSSGTDYHRSVTESPVETLTAYLRKLGSMGMGWTLRKSHALWLLNEIQTEKAKRIPSDDRSPLSFRRAR